MTLQQKKRTTEASQGLSFQCYLVTSGGLKIEQLQIGHLRYSLTLSNIKNTLKKPKSNISVSNSFITVKSAVQDSLIIVKLQFFLHL